MDHSFSKLVLALLLTIFFLLTRHREIPKLPVLFNFVFKLGFYFIIYDLFKLKHTADLLTYSEFLHLKLDGQIPNQDFLYPYGPWFLQLFGLFVSKSDYILWYLFINMIDSVILKIYLFRNESKDIFWFWLFNPLLIVNIQILGQNQILTIFFAVLSLVSYRIKLYIPSLLIALGSLIIKMIQFLYLPGYFITLWKESKNKVWLTFLPLIIYCYFGFMISKNWLSGVEHELHLLTPGNISFWVIRIIPKVHLYFLNLISIIMIFGLCLYWICRKQLTSNLLVISSFTTIAVFLLTNPRSYSQYWIFIFPLACLMENLEYRKKILNYLFAISVLIPFEMSFYFNFALKKEFSLSWQWFTLMTTDLAIISIGLRLILITLKYSDIKYSKKTH